LFCVFHQNPKTNWIVSMSPGTNTKKKGQMHLGVVSRRSFVSSLCNKNLAHPPCTFENFPLYSLWGGQSKKRGKGVTSERLNRNIDLKQSTISYSCNSNHYTNSQCHGQFGQEIESELNIAVPAGSSRGGLRSGAGLNMGSSKNELNDNPSPHTFADQRRRLDLAGDDNVDSRSAYYAGPGIGLVPVDLMNSSPNPEFEAETNDTMMENAVTDTDQVSSSRLNRASGH